MILEALLRLRQAAIHPGLLDKRHVAQPSAKLDVLLPRVLEVIEKGHKTLVFSQFTACWRFCGNISTAKASPTSTSMAGLPIAKPASSVSKPTRYASSF